MHNRKLLAWLVVIGLIIGFSGIAMAEDAAKININTATADELTQLKGVGEKIAADIVAYRQENGMFSSPEDLVNVKGIGPKTLADNINMITVGDVTGKAEATMENAAEEVQSAKE